MRIDAIISQRKLTNYPSFHLLFEWEDILSELLNIPIICENRWVRKLRCSTKVQKIPGYRYIVTSNRNCLMYELDPHRHCGYDKPNIIPVIVDFFLREEDELRKFYREYAAHKLIVITSKEAYDFLRERKCPLPIVHSPLSLPDSYYVPSIGDSERVYDLVMIGRQNALLRSFVEKYAVQHPDFVYVYQKSDGVSFLNYTNRGELICDIRNREEYMNFLRKTKVVIYGTPGMDGGEARTRGFNQVTPKLLEYVACGCHIIGRYPLNSDVDYYKLPDWLPNVGRYEEFERLMDRNRKTAPDWDFYKSYISKHLSSVRIKELMEIVGQVP